jgi:hypothetical protein
MFYKEAIWVHNFYNLNPNHQAFSSEFSNSISLDINVPLHNDKFHQLFDEYCLAPSESNQNNLGMHLNQMNYLIGIIPEENTSNTVNNSQITIKKGDALRFLICSNDNREVFLPIFTNDAEIKAWCSEPIDTLTVPAAWLWKFILNQKNYAGVLINPNSIAWSINLEHIQSLVNDMV